MVTDAGWLYEGSPRLSMPDLMFHYRAASFFGNVNAPDVPRHYLNGVLIEFGQGRLTCIATNGHMIGISTASAEIEIAAKVQRISSTQAAKQLLNILKCGELVEVTNSENALQF